MIIPIIFLMVGLILVLKGANFLVEGASSLAKRLSVPEIVIGLTIVAFGTSAPELIINTFSSIAGRNELVLGNIIGSNIFNLLFILGVVGLIYPLSFKRNSVRKEIPFSLVATLVFFLLANDRIFFKLHVNHLSRFDGIIFLFMLGFFLYYTIRLTKHKETEADKITVYSLPKTWLFIALGFAFLFIGGKLVVDYAVIIARKLHVSEKLIGLTIVSMGTSLPELATSIVAAFKKRSDLIVGNVIGSNIFNILLMLGISAEISPISYDVVFNLDIGILVLGTLFLMLSMVTFKKKILDRPEAAVFLVMYIVYMILVISRK